MDVAEITQDKTLLTQICDELRQLNHKIHILGLQSIKLQKRLNGLNEDRRVNFTRALEIKAIPNMTGNAETLLRSSGDGIDFSCLPGHLLDTPDEFAASSKIAQLDKEINDAKEILKAKPQNHRAKYTLNGVRDQLQILQEQTNQLASELRKLQQTKMKISGTRKDKFLRCFDHTREALAQ